MVICMTVQNLLFVGFFFLYFDCKVLDNRDLILYYLKNITPKTGDVYAWGIIFFNFIFKFKNYFYTGSGIHQMSVSGSHRCPP